MDKASNSPAIILSHGTGGLGAVRSLARRDIPVIVVAYDSVDLVRYSRYSKKIYVMSGSDNERESKILDLLDTLPDQGAALLTNSDRMVALVSRHRQRLSEKYRIALPAPEIVDALNDKKQETELIASLGFDIPKTVQRLPSDPATLQSGLRFPIIFKPYLYVAADTFPHKNAVVTDEKALHDFYHKWREAIPYLLAQEVIPGPDSYSWVTSCTFDKHHQMLDCGVKQKLRAYPAHFGGSTFAISRDNTEVLELTRRLGEKLDYVGHAGVEFRWDDRDRRYKYIEVNPRLPANVEFDEACGLSTVWNSYRVALNRSVAHSGAKQSNNIYFLDLKFDIFSLRADATPWSTLLATYLKLIFKPTSGLYFSWDDPMPGLALAVRTTIRGIQQIPGKLRLNRSMRSVSGASQKSV